MGAMMTRAAYVLMLIASCAAVMACDDDGSKTVVVREVSAPQNTGAVEPDASTRESGAPADEPPPSSLTLEDVVDVSRLGRECTQHPERCPDGTGCAFLPRLNDGIAYCVPNTPPLYQCAIVTCGGCSVGESFPARLFCAAP